MRQRIENRLHDWLNARPMREHARLQRQVNDLEQLVLGLGMDVGILITHIQQTSPESAERLALLAARFPGSDIRPARPLASRNIQ